MPRATKRDAFRAECRTKLVHELFDGVLYPKILDPIRGFIEFELIPRLRDYLDEHGIGFLVGSQATMALRRGIVVSPDVSFIPWSRTPNGKVPFESIPNLVPALAVDILGRSSTPDRVALRHRKYFRTGVDLAWVIEPRTRTANVYTAPHERTAVPASGTLNGGDVLPGFRLPLAKLFEQLEKPAAKKRRKK